MKKLVYFIGLTILFASCGGGKNENPNPMPVAADPVKTTLIAPAQNEICAQGKIISSMQSAVTLKWNNSANTDSYEVIIKNLESGVSKTELTGNTALDVTLERNTPYSWMVVSKSVKSNKTAVSDNWKFYNSGPGSTSYAPFPAEIIYPGNNQLITSSDNKISLSWSGSDVDNDVIEYDIYLGRSPFPDLYKKRIADNKLTDIKVVESATYYWKVISRDSKGNTSDSGIFIFKT